MDDLEKVVRGNLQDADQRLLNRPGHVAEAVLVVSTFEDVNFCDWHVNASSPMRLLHERVRARLDAIAPAPSAGGVGPARRRDSVSHAFRRRVGHIDSNGSIRGFSMASSMACSAFSSIGRTSGDIDGLDVDELPDAVAGELASIAAL